MWKNLTNTLEPCYGQRKPAESMSNQQQYGGAQYQGGGMQGMQQGAQQVAEQDRQHETRMKRLQDFDEFYVVYRDKLLGKGHFASVYLGLNKRRQQSVAVKEINRQSQSERTLRTEIEALLRIKGHPNIVSLYDVFVGKEHVILTMELLEGGELFNRIVSNGAYSERDASRHFRQLSEALLYMHENNIVHRDLKPENLVLKTNSPDSEILISDFGLSKILQEDQTLMATVCGTNAYAAPEIGFNTLALQQRNNKYDAKCDTWSLGVILYVILAAHHPFDPKGIMEESRLRERICTYQWSMNDKVWHNMSAEVKDLLKRLICPAPSRLTAGEILQQKWITDGQNMPANPIKSFSDRSLSYFVTSSYGAEEDYLLNMDEEGDYDMMNAS